MAMSDQLTNEVFRTLILRALDGANPDILEQALSDSPDESKLIGALKSWNDSQHSKLQGHAGILSDAARAVKSRRQPRY